VVCEWVGKKSQIIHMWDHFKYLFTLELLILLQVILKIIDKICLCSLMIKYVPVARLTMNIKKLLNTAAKSYNYQY